MRKKKQSIKHYKIKIKIEIGIELLYSLMKIMRNKHIKSQVRNTKIIIINEICENGENINHNHIIFLSSNTS